MIIDELIALLGYDIQGSEKLKQWTSSLDKAASTARTFATVVGGVAAAAGAAFVGGISSLAPAVLRVSGEFERYETQLSTLEGSAEKAKASMDWIAEFARATPYGLSQVTAAFVKLKSYGLDPIDGTLKSMGDWGAAMGKSLDQVVEAIADATTMEFERLKELGLRAKQDKDSITFSWTEAGKAMTATTAKTGEAINKFLNDYAGRRFGGAMEGLAKTWEGILDKVGDTWQAFLKKIGDAGFFDAMKDRLTGVLDTIDQWFESGKVDRIAKIISNSLVVMVDTIGTIIDRVVTHLDFLFSKLDQIEPYFEAIAIAIGLSVAAFAPWMTALALAALAIEDYLTYLQGGKSVIGDFVAMLKDSGTELGAWVEYLGGIEHVATGVGIALGVLLAVLFPVTAGLIAAGVVISDFWSYLRGGESYIGDLIAWFDSLGSTGYWIAGVLGALAAVFFPVTAAIAGLIAALADLWSYFSGGESYIGDFITWVSALWDTIANWGSGVFDGITSAVQGVVDSVTGLFGRIWESIQAAFAADQWKGIGALAAGALLDGIGAAAEAIISAIANIALRSLVAFLSVDWGGIAGKVIGALTAGFMAYVTFLADFWQGAGEAALSVDWAGLVGRIIAALAGAFMGYVDFLAGFWAEVGNRAIAWASGIGARIAGALSNAVSGAVGRVRGFFGGGDETPAAAPAAGSPATSTPAAAAVTPQKQSSILTPETKAQLAEMIKNANGNIQKTDLAQAAPAVMTDNSQDNREFPVTVNAPVNVNVAQATQAPAAVGQAVSGAVNRGVQAQPARMQSGPAT